MPGRQPAFAELRALGFATAALALRDDARPIGDAAIAALPKLALLLGTEGDGLLPETIAACDYTLRIPDAPRRGFAQRRRGCGGRVLGAGRALRRRVEDFFIFSLFFRPGP